MTKQEMIKKLEAEGIDVPDLKWGPLQKFYKEKMDELTPPVIFSKPTEESVEEVLEKHIERNPDKRTPLEIARGDLFPKIVDLMNRLKGRSNATHGELNEMFSLYNQFYLRADSPTCGSCVGRVFSTFKKMCKGRI